MSFSNPLQLSGRQLENYNKSQRALENIKSPDSQQQQSFQSQQRQQMQSSEQKSKTQFGVGNSQSFGAGDQGNIPAADRTQTKQVSFSESSGFKFDTAQPAKTQQQNNSQMQLQGYSSTPGSTPQGESRLLFKNGSQGRGIRKQEDPEEAISELVNHSDKTIRQIEDQFKSLNAGSGANQRGFSQDKSTTPVTKLNGAKIQHIKSEVDRLIMQAEIQNKQNNLGAQNNRDSRYSAINDYGSRGRDFSGNRREDSYSSSPRKHKRNERSKSSKKSHSKQKDHHRSKKSKHSKREYSSDDTSSYSGESDSVIMEQENESRFDDSSNEENYEEDERKQRKHNKHRHSKHRQEQPKSDTKSYLQELEARSVSNYSKNPSQQRKRTPSNHSLRLDKDNLKKLPSYGLPPMNKGENSVYSSASRMRQHQQQVSEGFRRAPEKIENNNRQENNYQENRLKQGKNNQNEAQLEDSFDAHEDFQVYNSNKQVNIKSSRVSGVERPSNMQALKDNNGVIAQSTHRRAPDTSDDDNEADLYKPYVAPEKSNYSQNIVKQQVQKDLSARIHEQRQVANYQDQSEFVLGLAAMEEDSVIFCVNCEEYIKAEKVDAHSNVCQSNKENRTCSQREYIYNINEKLTKIRFLIKNKQNHLLSFSRNATSQEGLGLFQSAFELISLSIDTNGSINDLNNLIEQLKDLNKQLAKSRDTFYHSLLYLSCKGIEFAQRKSEFLSRYGNDKFDADDGVLSYAAPSVHTVSNNRNFDEISYASSTIRQGTNFSKQRRDPVQIFSQIDNDLNIFKPKQQQLNNYGAVVMSPPQKSNGYNENTNQFISPKSNYSHQNDLASRQEGMNQKANGIIYEQQGQNINNYAQQNQQQLYGQQQQQQPVNQNKQQNPHPFSVRAQQPIEEKNQRQQVLEQNQQGFRQQQQQNGSQQPPKQQQQPFSQKAPTFLEPVETVTVKEAQISRPSNQRNSYQPNQHLGLARQMNQDVSNYSSLDAQKKRFFQLAHSMKQQYPSSNQFLIAELWIDAQNNKIIEKNWNQFLISKFS